METLGDTVFNKSLHDLLKIVFFCKINFFLKVRENVNERAESNTRFGFTTWIK